METINNNLLHLDKSNNNKNGVVSLNPGFNDLQNPETIKNQVKDIVISMA